MINDTSIEKFKPVQGIMVFRRHNSEYYLQTHNIADVGGKYTWEEGKPFHKEQLAELALCLSRTTLSTLKLKGLMPENVLYFQPSISGDKYLWYLPAGQHYLNFHPDLKLSPGLANLPGLIFAVNNKTIYVFAVKGNDKPAADTSLWKGPFFNVYADSSVCMGTTRESKKRKYLEEELVRWERRFFGSRFTHVSDEDVLEKGHNISLVYQSILAGEPFPEAALAPSKHKTLGSFLKSFIKGIHEED